MNKLSLNAKIYLVLSIFIIASVVISVFGLSKLSDSRQSLDNIISKNAFRIQKVHELNGVYLQHLIYARDMLMAESNEKVNEVADKIKGMGPDVKARRDELHASLLPAGKKNILEFYELYEKYVGYLMQIKELKLQGKVAEGTQLLYGTAAKLRTALTNNLNAMVERNVKLMGEAADQAEADYNTARWLMIVISCGSILFGLALATVVLRAMGKTIDQVISNLTDNSYQVTGAAQQIASSSEELSQAATEQASSLEETAASIEEMNSMVQKNAENALRTSELAVNSSNSAEKGKIVVTDMIKAINDISVSNNTIMVQVDESNQKISDIVKVISEIGNKTKVINDIVFQTKLLSFNASVEAARAGEHGKGFAVVAEEVGNLAQMSGNAAKEISSMLDESIQKVEGIVNETKQKVSYLIQDGKAKVEVGSQIAKQCGDVLEEIVTNITQVTQMANEISTACQEQSQGVQEITKAMNQLDQVTQTNASTSEEAASSAEELAAQSDALKSVVGTLVKTIKGENASVDTTVQVRPTSSAEKTTQHKAHAQNVVQMKPQKVKKPVAQTQIMKRASGDGSSIPAENDPRFEDV